MKRDQRVDRVMKTLMLTALLSVPSSAGMPNTGVYDDLVTLLREVRQLERTETRDGVPDYTASTMSSVQRKLMALRERLHTIDTTGWTLEQKIDREIVRAEINGFDFFIRILKPWERDPAFYVLIFANQSDTPEHEGPVSHAMIDLWKYSYPLSKSDAQKLTAQLRIIPPLLDQARQNLTGNAKDLWMGGIQSAREQVQDLDDLIKRIEKPDKNLKDALQKARIATIMFAEWLEQVATQKNGPSGIGKENYTWFLRNVLLVPMTWEEELTLLRRELDRAYAMLTLERQHNRNLPPLNPASETAEFERRTNAAVNKMMAFFTDRKVYPVRPYMEPELRKHLGRFQLADQRNFFSNVLHHEPAVLYSHLIHWFEIAALREEPHSSPVRRDPLPFNIWVSRSEGMATAVEEIFMHAGLYDDNARARELVWIMLAQRCARGIASLYAHANEMSMIEAQDFQIEGTPKEWRGVRGLVIGEQHLYLRLPGYGTSYVTGKYLIDRLIKDRSRQLGDSFILSDFFNEVNMAGMIPVTLIRWQLTGRDDEMKSIVKP